MHVGVGPNNFQGAMAVGENGQASTGAAAAVRRAALSMVDFDRGFPFWTTNTTLYLMIYS